MKSKELLNKIEEIEKSGSKAPYSLVDEYIQAKDIENWCDVIVGESRVKNTFAPDYYYNWYESKKGFITLLN